MFILLCCNEKWEEDVRGVIVVGTLNNIKEVSNDNVGVISTINCSYKT